MGNLRVGVNREFIREGDETLESGTVAQAEKKETLLKAFL